MYIIIYTRIYLLQTYTIHTYTDTHTHKHTHRHTHTHTHTHTHQGKRRRSAIFAVLFFLAEWVQQGEDSREGSERERSAILQLVRRGLAHDAKVRQVPAGLLLLDRLSKGYAEQAQKVIGIAAERGCRSQSCSLFLKIRRRHWA